MKNIEKVIELLKDINEDVTYSKIEREDKNVNSAYIFNETEAHYTVVLKFKN